MKTKVNWFSGQEILVEDMGHLNDGYQHADQHLFTDLWRGGVIKDPNGLSSFFITVDALTATLVNVGWGVGYSPIGHRIAIEADAVYSAANPTQTLNGVCVPQSTGNKAIPLASYVAGQSNFFWAQYLEVARTNPLEISSFDGSKHYPFADAGYQIVVSTNSAPLADAVLLGTVFGQGVGQPLVPAPNGLCQSQEQFASLIPKDSIGTQNLQDRAVTPQKIAGGNFTFDGICAVTIVGSSNVTVPLQPLLPTSAASKKFSQYAGFGIATSKTVFYPVYDGNLNIAYITVAGDSTGLITPVYDGMCNMLRVIEAIDSRTVSHEITWQSTADGTSLIYSVEERGV